MAGDGFEGLGQLVTCPSAQVAAPRTGHCRIATTCAASARRHTYTVCQVHLPRLASRLTAGVPTAPRPAAQTTRAAP